jgi:hypothetical protein
MSRRDGLQLNGVAPGAIELPEKRWEHGVFFDNKNGTCAFIISAFVNYKDVNNVWQEIDNRWEPGTWHVSSEDWDYRMVQCGYRAYVKSKFDVGGSLLRLEKDTHWLEYNPRDLLWATDGEDEALVKHPQPIYATKTDIGADSLVQQGYLDWINAYGAGISFRYTPSTHFFAKELTINSLAELGTPPTRISTKPGACLQLGWMFSSDLDLYVDGVIWDKTTKKDTGAAVVFKDVGGNTIWSWENPTATDAAGNTVAGTIRLIKRGTNLYSVSIQIPWPWLQTAMYPVVVDPTTYYGAADDGYIYGQGLAAVAHATSYGSDATSTVFRVGVEVASGVNTFWRSFLSFVTSGITANYIVTAATLQVQCYGATSGGSNMCYLKQCNWATSLSANREADYDACDAADNDLWQKNINAMGSNAKYIYAVDLSYIKTAGTTKYAFKCELDSGGYLAPMASYVDFFSFGSATQASRPQLSITAVMASRPEGKKLFGYIHPRKHQI